MNLTKNYLAALAIFLIAGTAPVFGKIVQPKVTVQILTPTANQHATTPAFVISGNATSKSAIVGVFYQLNAGDWTPASLFSSGKKWDAVVTLTPGTNTLRVYARDSAGNVSATNSVKFFYDTASKSLVGLTAAVTDGSTSFVLSFGTNTFSLSADDPNDFDDNGVGTYIYSKLNSSAGRVTLTFKSPFTSPPALEENNNKSIFTLQFTTNNSGSFTNSGGGTEFFTFTNAPALVATEPLDTVVLDDNSGDETILVFPPPSTIFDNGHLFNNVHNPLTIPLDAAYPGNIGDRVSVDLAHYGFSKGGWNLINKVKDSGTVTSFGLNSGGTNSVTVFFDVAPFISSKDAFIPLAGGEVRALTFFYTNAVDGSTMPGGTFAYTNYSPIAALLTTVVADETNFYILTFTNSDVGNYFGESVDSSGPVGENSGAFNLSASFGGGDDDGDLAPASVTGETLMATNNAFFESVEFVNSTAFLETNSYNAANSTGNYFYTSNSVDEATVELDYTSGATGFTNLMELMFVTATSGNFTNTISNSGSSTNFSGQFNLQ